MICHLRKSIDKDKTSNLAFTIVELLVVIVVIAILATLTIVSYIGITRNATISVIKADLSNANKALANYRTLNDETYPLTIDCSGPNLDLTTNLCLSPGTNISYTYSVDNSNPPSYTLYAQNTDKSITYKLTSSNSTYSEVSQNKTCPNNFILVPGSSTYNTSDFCVAKYEMKIYGNDNGAVAYNAANLPTSRPGGTPYVNISQTNAILQAFNTVDSNGTTVGAGKNLAKVSEDGISYKPSTTTPVFSADSVTVVTANSWSGDHVYFNSIPRQSTMTVSWLSETQEKTTTQSAGAKPLLQLYDNNGNLITDLATAGLGYYWSYNDYYKAFAWAGYNGTIIYNDGVTSNTRLISLSASVAIVKFGLSFGDSSVGKVIKASNVQLEKGSATTTYEPYAANAHLITEAEWMTIAQNVLSQPKNWSSGTVGTGFIYNGHVNNNPAIGLSASGNDANSNSGEDTYNNSSVGANNKRTLTLTNGEVIWDLSGNVWDWTQGQTTGGQPGLITDPSGNLGSYPVKQWNNSSLLQNGFPEKSLPSPTGLPVTWNTSYGIGGLYSNYYQTALRGFIRGGSWIYGGAAGVLCLSLGNGPTGANAGIGFRVVVSPQ